jgi:hypothetical protein
MSTGSITHASYHIILIIYKHIYDSIFFVFNGLPIFGNFVKGAHGNFVMDFLHWKNRWGENKCHIETLFHLCGCPCQE